MSCAGFVKRLLPSKKSLFKPMGTVDRNRGSGPAWRQLGEEPDYRFTLANERTFLAWIRTALAVLAAGVLFDQFSTKLQPHLIVVVVAAFMCIAAAALCGISYFRWARNEQAMRHKAPLPYSRALGLLAAAVLAAGALIACLILVYPIGNPQCLPT